MTARKIKRITKCLECGEDLSGRSSQRYCGRECGVKWRTKHVYRYKYAHKHRSSSPANFLRVLRNKKSSRNSLSVEFLTSLYEKQNGKCAISGVQMTYVAGNGRVDTNISIDQIVAGGGYSEGNVQLVCCRVNHMKYDQSLDNLLMWCKEIVSNNQRDGSQD